MFSKKDALDLDARREIYECVRKSPGLHFREIQRRVNLATGSLDYHLHFLHRHGLLRCEKSGRFLRYYPSDTAYAQEEKDFLGLLRQEKIRHILIYLIENKRANATSIADALGMTQSNLSWYLRILIEKNLVTQKKRGRFKFYSVNDRKKIIAALLTYKSSFLDKLVDSFIESWEEKH